MNEHTVITGKIHSLETFGLVDGPGVRCVVFLQGCHMRCRYCHNPETWSMQGGEDSTAEEMFHKVYRYRNYWGKDGGLTVSGGEPLLQLDFVTEFFRLAKEKKINTALDTSGNPFLMTPHYLADHGKSMWIRHVLVPGLTDSEEDLLALRDLERSLPTLKRVEVLPYHTLGLFKWKKLGITYSLNGVPTPTEEEVRRAEEILEVHKY